MKKLSRDEMGNFTANRPYEYWERVVGFGFFGIIIIAALSYLFFGNIHRH